MDPAGAGLSLAGETRLALVTGLSGSGKRTVLSALEDVGHLTVDNLPVDLLEQFVTWCQESALAERAALVVDIREGEGLTRFPALYGEIRKILPTVMVYLEASDVVLQRRFSETRRPHPVDGANVMASIAAERALMEPIRQLADIVLDTSRFNVHDLRRTVQRMAGGLQNSPKLRITLGSFGFKYGPPPDADMTLDVRFLPNPNYETGCRQLTGRDPRVVQFLEGYPQTRGFFGRAMNLLEYVVPRYAEEGKSYLAIYFGCTGGRHRSVYIANAAASRLKAAGYDVRVQHRDIDKER